ncbi:MAG TPA: phosphatase PAP2 family protein [Candidatus Saccharimonadales bacterium]|nr:phosphatase PAP2 family protein [Candidatus Saccharimonadales bacterium]
MQQLTDIIIRIMADGLVVPIVLIAAWVMLRLPRKERLDKIARGIVAGLVALLSAKLLSLIYQDGERPFMILGVDPKAAYLNNPGFPSDHVLFVFAITFVVWASTKNKPLSLTLLIMSIMVAAGRVLALVHTPLDVLGGFAAALLAVTLVYGRDFYRTERLPR